MFCCNCILALSVHSSSANVRPLFRVAGGGACPVSGRSLVHQRKLFSQNSLNSFCLAGNCCRLQDRLKASTLLLLALLCDSAFTSGATMTTHHQRRNVHGDRPSVSCLGRFLPNLSCKGSSGSPLALTASVLVVPSLLLPVWIQRREQRDPKSRSTTSDSSHGRDLKFQTRSQSFLQKLRGQNERLLFSTRVL